MDARIRNNHEGYTLVFTIENVLRELIIDELSATQDGHAWFKRRVPQDVKEHCLDLRKEELELQRGNALLLHLLYYADFMDLSKVVARNDNWTERFQSLFGSDQTSFTGMMQSIYPIRNKLAHNRVISDLDLAQLRGAYAQLLSRLGDSRFFELAKRLTAVSSLAESLDGIVVLIEHTRAKITDGKPIDDISVWVRASSEWWLSDDFLEIDVSVVRRYFRYVAEYSSRPRHRGDGYLIEKWLRENDVLQIAERARTEIRKVLVRDGRE